MRLGKETLKLGVTKNGRRILTRDVIDQKHKEIRRTLAGVFRKPADEALPAQDFARLLHTCVDTPGFEHTALVGLARVPKKEAFWEALVLFNNTSDPELKFQAIHAAFDCLSALKPEEQHGASMQIYFAAGSSEIEKMALEKAFEAIGFLRQKDQFSATKKVFDKATDPDLRKRATERLRLFATVNQAKALEQIKAPGSLGPNLEVVPF